LVTSGTGHDRCPSPGPGPWGARTPPSRGIKKISKVVFGFKRVFKNFLEVYRRSSDATLAIRFINKILRRGALRDLTVCWAEASRPYVHQLVPHPSGVGVVENQPSSENRAYRDLRWAAAAASVSAGVVARSSQCSTAWVTVGAVGPNAQHVLHATNFGSRSMLIQRFEPPQKGQGRDGCTEPGRRSGPLSPDLWAMFVDPPCLDSQSLSGLFRAFSSASTLSRRRSISARTLGPGLFFKAAEPALLLRQQGEAAAECRRLAAQLVLMAMRLTLWAACSVLGRVTVRTPLRKLASALSS